MRKRSGGNWGFWIGSLTLLLAAGCMRQPDAADHRSADIVSTLFKIDGVVNGEKVRGTRAYLHAGVDGRYLMVLMTVTNSPVVAVLFDGASGTVVDFQNRTAMMDVSASALVSRLPFPVDIGELADFYRDAVVAARPQNRTFRWGKIIYTESGRVAVLPDNGDRLLLTPVKGPEFGVMTRLALPVPAGYRVIHDPDHSLSR